MKGIIKALVFVFIITGCGQEETDSGLAGDLDDFYGPGTNLSDSVVKSYRKKAAKNGGWCSRKGSLLIHGDFNVDGFQDRYCKDRYGNEWLENGIMKFYHLPAYKKPQRISFLHEENMSP